MFEQIEVFIFLLCISIKRILITLVLLLVSSNNYFLLFFFLFNFTTGFKCVQKSFSSWIFRQASLCAKKSFSSLFLSSFILALHFEFLLREHRQRTLCLKRFVSRKNMKPSWIMTIPLDLFWMQNNSAGDVSALFSEERSFSLERTKNGKW